MTDCNKNPCMFAQIDSAIIQMQNTKKYLDDAFIALEGKAQEKIDEIIVKDINPTINAKLASIRSALLKSLQAQYQAFVALSAPLQTINDSDPSNLTKVIQFCKDVKDFLVGAFATLMTFMSELTTHLGRLTVAITDIVAYTPPISGISFSKLDIKMEEITMNDITGGGVES